MCWNLFTGIRVQKLPPHSGRLISSPGIEISEVTAHLDALNRYRKTKAHFVDCLIAATAVAKNLAVSTFEQDFRKFVDVRLETE